MEFTDGNFLHLAVVDNPRYERANIVVNSKDDEKANNNIERKENTVMTALNELEKFVRNIVENKVDFGKTRNVIVAAIILVLSIGVTYSANGSISIPCGDFAIVLTGLAVGSLAGIVLNALLPGKDYQMTGKGLKDVPEKELKEGALEADLKEEKAKKVSK